MIQILGFGDQNKHPKDTITNMIDDNPNYHNYDITICHHGNVIYD